MRGLILLVALAGCIPKGAKIEDAPATDTREGRQEVRLELASTLLDSGRVVEAQQLLAAAAKEGLKGPDLLVLQGRALLAQGLFEQAREQLAKAAKEAPKDPRPLRWLALLEVDAGNKDQAVQHFAKAVTYGPNDAATWNNYGFVLFSTGKYAEADEALSKAVKLDGTRPRYRLNLAFNQAALRHDNEALQSFRSAGTEADAQENLGLACELRGDNDLAKQHYELAVRANPSQKKAADALQRLNTATNAHEVHP